jgi:hypothetical protein
MMPVIAGSIHSGRLSRSENGAASGENKLKMKNAFVTAMKLEYMFWDGVYNRVQWVK